MAIGSSHWPLSFILVYQHNLFPYSYIKVIKDTWEEIVILHRISSEQNNCINPVRLASFSLYFYDNHFMSHGVAPSNCLFVHTLISLSSIGLSCSPLFWLIPCAHHDIDDLALLRGRFQRCEIPIFQNSHGSLIKVSKNKGFQTSTAAFTNQLTCNIWQRLEIIPLYRWPHTKSMTTTLRLKTLFT